MWVLFGFLCFLSQYLSFPPFVVGVFIPLSLLSRAPLTTLPPRSTLKKKTMLYKQS